MVKKTFMHVFGVQANRGKLEFIPLFFEKDPLLFVLSGKNQRSRWLFEASNLINHEIHEGESWLVEMEDCEILYPKTRSADRRATIKIRGHILERVVMVSSRDAKILYRTIVPNENEFDDAEDRLEEYLALDLGA